MQWSAGTCFDRYRIVEPWNGQGIHRAKDVESDRVVALKVAIVRDATARAGCIARARATAVLVHPNIAAVLAVGEKDSAVWVAREFVAGSVWLASAGADMHRRMLTDVARALVFSHRRGIAHGALHAGNVLVDALGTVRLTDFALAREGSVEGDIASWGRLALDAPGDTHREVIDRAIAGGFSSMMEVLDALERVPGDGVGDGAAFGTVAFAPTERAAKPSNRRPPAVAPTGSRVRRAGIGVALLALITLFALWTLSPFSSTVPHGSPFSNTVPHVEANTSSPSQSFAAQALFAAAMQAARDASITQANSQLLEVLRLDPAFAQAHLRLGLLSEGTNEAARAHLQRAHDLRASLEAHDLKLLEAFEPCVNDPPAPRETVVRMERAAAASPDDADFALLLGRAYWLASDFARAIDALTRAASLDPSLAIAVYYRALARLAQNDPGAFGDLERCIAMSPAAAICLLELGRLEARQGKCEDAEREFRRLIAIDPTNPDGYYRLAATLDGEQRPREAVRIALDRYIERLASPDRERRDFAMRAYEAESRGAFEDAERAFEDWETLLNSESDLEQHLIPIDARLELYLEMGRLEDTATLARATLAQVAGWTQDRLFGDMNFSLYVTLYRAKAITRDELVRRRDAWVSAQLAAVDLVDGIRLGRLWGFGFGPAIVSRADAQDSLDAIATLPPMVAPLRREPVYYDRWLGLGELLLGRPAAAVAHLETAHASCEWLVSALPHVQLELPLGQALEASGDRAGACEAYGRVRRHWGRASKSLTAREASARAHRLACASPE